jgi:uncharacterized repeat protein (TIGR04052 family)
VPRLPIAALIAAMLTASCSRPAIPISVPFAAQIRDRVLTCQEPYQGVALTDMRFFLQDPQLINAQGERVALHLDADRWQQSDLAFIDLEDGAANCVNGTADLNVSLRGTIAADDYKGLEFYIGVPFDRNHADPLAAAAPLGNPAMHWHWRAGYKFMRAGIKTDSDGFWIHLGSAGCEGKVRDIKSCRYPNRVKVQLPDFVPGQDGVVVDLEQLMLDTDLEDGMSTDCSSGPAETACAAPFKSLGIDYNGEQSARQQRVIVRKVMR